MGGATGRGLGRRSARLAAAVSLPVPKKVTTKDLLIDTAEQLFGRLGVDGVSLREIASAAGQANSNVVQYHFKDKAGLVGAILDDRVGRIEELRRERLESMKAEGRDDPRELLSALWLPILSVRDSAGVHTFCRFLLQVMLQSHIDQHPVRKLYSSAGGRDGKKEASLPYVLKATRLLRAHFDHLPESVLNRRMSSLSMMFLATVVEHDNAKLSGKLPASSEFDAEPILDMALGALSVG
jgi:AcrR family transcriptional regulator